MNPNLQIAVSKAATRGMGGLRDSDAGRSDPNATTQDFDNVLAGVSDGSATVDVNVTTKVPLSVVSTSAKTSIDTPLLRLLLDPTPSTAKGDASTSTPASTTDNGTDVSPPAVAPTMDPSMLPLNAAFVAVQASLLGVSANLPTATIQAVDTSTTAAGTALSTAALAASIATPNAMTGSDKVPTAKAADAKVSFPATTVALSDLDEGSAIVTAGAVSAIKVESHLAGFDRGTAGSRPDPKADTTLTASAEPPVTHAETSPTSTTQAPPTSKAAKPDAPPIVVPATTTPTQAVTSVIAKALDTPVVRATPEAPATSVPAPARTMILQLTPASLGTVSVTMHLVGQSLDLQIVASDKDTLGTISRDRDTLSKAVQDQGYDLRTLVVQGTDTSAASTGDSNTARGQGGNAQAQAGADGQRAQSGPGGQRQDDGQSTPRPQRTKTDDTPRASAGSRAGALFV